MRDSANDENSQRKLSCSHNNQISVLRTLSYKGFTHTPPRQFQINEIAELSGVCDEKEVQRYLFILEGQKLVAPFPEGDFTSKVWHITKVGQRALRTIQCSAAA